MIVPVYYLFSCVSFYLLTMMMAQDFVHLLLLLLLQQSHFLQLLINSRYSSMIVWIFSVFSLLMYLKYCHYLLLLSVFFFFIIIITIFKIYTGQYFSFFIHIFCFIFIQINIIHFFIFCAILRCLFQ